MVYEPEFLLRKIDVTINGEPLFGKNRSFPATMADIDVAQMERVFLNLIGNGVKHANKKIEIEISVIEGIIHCSVKDDGRGVNVNKLRSIFDDYVQVSDKNSGATKGVGLGLPIVRRIIELHCGAITADSNIGGGFCVDFSIPRTLADRKNGKQTG
jgi:signal transduction histidine kinase